MRGTRHASCCRKNVYVKDCPGGEGVRSELLEADYAVLAITSAGRSLRSLTRLQIPDTKIRWVR